MVFDDEINDIGEELNIDEIEYNLFNNIVPKIKNLVSLLEEMYYEYWKHQFQCSKFYLRQSKMNLSDLNLILKKRLKNDKKN